MEKTMLGLVTNPDGVVALEEVPVPRLGENPYAPHDVLLEVEYCGICGSDIHKWGAGKEEAAKVLHPERKVVQGHEIVARVREIGQKVTRVKPGDRVVCAISTQGPVGIDIEEKRPIDPLELSSFFTETEWRRIAAATDRISLFFELWTQKESVMKADGRGMRLDPKRIVIEMNQARVIGANSYRLHMLNVAPDYMCCLATVEETPEVRIIDNDIKNIHGWPNAQSRTHRTDR